MALKVEQKGLRSLKAAFWLASPKRKDSATFTLRCLPTSFTGASGMDSPSMCTKTRRRVSFTWVMSRTISDTWSECGDSLPTMRPLRPKWSRVGLTRTSKLVGMDPGVQRIERVLGTDISPPKNLARTLEFPRQHRLEISILTMRGNEGHMAPSATVYERRAIWR